MTEQVSKERLAELLKAEANEKARKEKHIAYARRRNMKIQLLADKAIKANITVSEDEITQALSKVKKKV